MSSDWGGLTPRAWQAEALPVVVDAARAGGRPVVAAVMGSGKSVLQAEVIATALPVVVQRGHVVVVVAPRQRLVRQLGATIAARVGAERVGLFYADEKQAGRPVVVCCAASLGALSEALDRRVALLVIDEAHGSEAPTVRATVPALRPASLVGFTATPYRSTASETLSLFDLIAYRYTIEDAVRDGALVPPRVEMWRGLDSPPDIDRACLELMQAHAEGPGVVSARTIEDADDYAAYLTAHGWPAEVVHSGRTAEEQDATIERLRTGELRAVVHVAMLSEGVDLPWLRWICLRRRVQARVRVLQEAGRVLRAHPGKAEGVILDPWGVLAREGWTTPEAIGAAMEADAEDTETRPAPSARELDEGEVIAIDRLAAWLAETVAMWRRMGVLEEDAAGGAWRALDASARQVEGIRKRRAWTRIYPASHSGPIKALMSVPWALSRGQASDLLGLLIGSYRWRATHAARTGRQAYMVRVPAEWLPRIEDAVCKVAAAVGRRADREDARG